MGVKPFTVSNHSNCFHYSCFYVHENIAYILFLFISFKRIHIGINFLFVSAHKYSGCIIGLIDGSHKKSHQFELLGQHTNTLALVSASRRHIHRIWNWDILGITLFFGILCICWLLLNLLERSCVSMKGCGDSYDRMY